MYVDYNADGMYDFFVDGELFDVKEPVVSTDIDLCCQDAVDNLNLKVMNLACVPSSVDEDEFFIFDDALTCTRAVDRATDYFKHADTEKQTSLHTHTDYCVEESVDLA